MKQRINGALGLDVSEIVVRVIRAHPEIERIFFGLPKINPPLQKRLGLSSQDREVILDAAKESRQTKLPGWYVVMLSLFRSQHPSETILRQAAFHQSISRTLYPLASDNLGVQKIHELADRTPPNRILSLCSEVRLKNGPTKHIPMMDFHCPISDHSLSLVCNTARLFDVGPGFVVETERSYHFYGSQVLLSDPELASFLGRALLFSPIVDHAWIAHQLMDMCCALQVTARTRSGKVPRVVGIVQ